MRLKILIVAILSFPILSCEGNSRISGVVKNSKGEVLNNVRIIYNEDRHTITHSDTIFSDVNGKFEISNLVMCAPKCPNTELIFQKDKFNIKTVNFKEKILDTILEINLEEIEK